MKDNLTNLKNVSNTNNIVLTLFMLLLIVITEKKFSEYVGSISKESNNIPTLESVLFYLEILFLFLVLSMVYKLKFLSWLWSSWGRFALHKSSFLSARNLVLSRYRNFLTWFNCDWFCHKFLPSNRFSDIFRMALTLLYFSESNLSIKNCNYSLKVGKQI